MSTVEQATTSLWSLRNVVRSNNGRQLMLLLLLALLASSQDGIQLVLHLRDVTVSGFQGHN